MREQSAWKDLLREEGRTVREQPGGPLPSRAGRHPHVSTQGASRHSVGTACGLHPEDRPSQTDQRKHQTMTSRQPIPDDTEDDDTLYPSRIPTSTRRYAPATTPARTVMRVTHHQGLPPIQRASRTHARADQHPEPAPTHQRKEHVHFSVYIGLAMLIMLIGWIVFSGFSQWWQLQQDTWHYGTPRTFQVDADVKHGGMSHFTIENLNGHIVVYEVLLTNLSKMHLYLGPTFSGPGTEFQPATVSFEDINGDGYPDLIISVGTGRYPFINDHSGFRPVNASDHIISGKGV